MANVNLSKKDKDLYLTFLRQYDECGLYEKVLNVGLLRAATDLNADIAILNVSESFLSLYRRTGNNDYAAISRVLRRAAHAVSRELTRQHGKYPDPKFLTLIS